MTVEDNIRKLEAEENIAWERLLNDPRCIADPRAEHTPELMAAWNAACDALVNAQMRASLSQTSGTD